MTQTKTKLDIENEKAAYQDGRNLALEGYGLKEVTHSWLYDVWFDDGFVHAFMKGYEDAQKGL